MRNALKVLLVVALAIPTLASAAISSTKHNLTASGPGPARFTDAPDQCMFCHLVHDANTTKKALWARADPTVAAFTAGTTVAGTTLPASAAALGDGSKQCLSCHDGSVAVNTVTSTTTATIWVAAASTSTQFTATGNIFKLNNTSTTFLSSLNGQHPVGIPFPGSTVGGVTSKAAVGEYGTVQISGCDSGVSVCVTSPVATAGTAVKLYGSVANTYSVECGSCHEPHKADVGGNFLNFLRVSKATTNGRCGACHIK